MPLVLLDRDGVLNVDRSDSVKSPGDLSVIPGAAEAVARLNRAGWHVALVTNQSIVGRGVIGAAMLDRIHEKLAGDLAAAGAHLDAVFVCTDRPDRPTERRKPNPGMLREALDRFAADPETTTMIGDDLRDLEAAARAGCARVLVRTGKGRAMEAAGWPPALDPVFVADDLAAAIDHLLSQATET